MLLNSVARRALISAQPLRATLHACPIDCDFGLWAIKSGAVCSKSCGGGQIEWVRPTLVATAHGGEACPSLAEYRTCNGENCAVDCVVGNFTEFSDCSQSCGSGTHKRSRTVVQPVHGGKGCPHTHEAESCSSQACPIDCHHTVHHHNFTDAWDQFSGCSATCGSSGTRSRTRDLVQPEHGGKACPSESDTEECNRFACPRDCGVGTWTDYSSCSKTCGGGVMGRNRTSTAPEAGGKICPHNVEFVPCNGQTCPVDCVVGDWDVEWSACSVSCGTGSQTKKRTNVAPAFGGKACPSDTKLQDCTTCCPGTFKTDEGACSPCTGNTFSSTYDNLECTTATCCASSTYKFGHTASMDGSCLSCAQGTFSTNNATAGEACANSGCTSCAAGKYGAGSKSQASSDHCTCCPAGTFTGEQGAHNNNAQGLHGCSVCGDGKYQPAECSTSCITCTTSECPEGEYESTPCNKTADRVCSKKPVLGGITGCFDFIENDGASAFAALADITFAANIASASVTFVKDAETAGDKLLFADTSSVKGTQRENDIESVLDLVADGIVSAHDFTAALRTVKFNSPGDMHGKTADRTLNIVIKVCHTAGVCSDLAEQCVNVKPVNDSPVIAGIPSTDRTFTLGGDAELIASSIAITDKDNNNLKLATVTIEAAQVGDVLTFDVGATGISGAYDAATAKATFAGAASIELYNQVLRTVAFSTTSTSTVMRAFSFIATDSNSKQSGSSANVDFSICARAGSFENTLQNALVACPTGKYQASACATSCEACVAGKHGDGPAGAVAESHCDTCSPGTYQTSAGAATCIGCSPGRFGDANVGVDDEKHCVNCAAGTSQSASSQITCVACAEEHFSLDQAATCTPLTTCGAGKYKVGAASDTDGTCDWCDTGSWSVTDDLAACTRCDAGTRGDGAIARTSDVHCVACDMGRYSASGSTACISCLEGKFAASTGLAACSTCTIGQWQSETGQASCTQCVPGRFGKASVARTSVAHCESCAHGSIAVSEGLTACEPCELGTYADLGVAKSSADHCKPCNAGKYQDEIAFVEVCKTCATGRFQPTTTKATSCTQCSGACSTAGEYISTDCTLSADRVCSAIPVVGGVSGKAYYTEDAAAVVPADAATVTFASTIKYATVAIVGGTANDVLAAGPSSAITSVFTGGELTLTSEGGSASAGAYEELLRTVAFSVNGHMAGIHDARTVTLKFFVCHSDSVCSDAKEMEVTVTPLNDVPVVGITGTFTYTQSDAGLAVLANAVLTDADDASLQSATVKITNVFAGDQLEFTLPSDSTLQGTYTAATGQLRLVGGATLAQYQSVLRAVTFRSTTGTGMQVAQRSIAVILNDGRETSASAPQVTIDMCAAPGYFASEGEGASAPCANGSYQADACQTQCVSCAAGTFGDEQVARTSSAHCKACALGSYQAVAGATSCTACTAGHFGAAGTIQTSAAAHCHKCAVGTAQSAEGAASCTNCLAGSFSAMEGTATCDTCAAGHFQNATAASECTACSVGTSSGIEGATAASTCTACDTGSYAATVGSATCEAWECCDAGAENRGASTTTAGVCHTCVAGFFRPKASCSAEPCVSWGEQCKAGKFMLGASTTTAGTCEACNPGSYKEAAGFEACTLCAAGKFGNMAGLASGACDACAKGHYSEIPGSTSCIACDAGTFTTGVASKKEQCKTCTATTWQPWSACSKTCGSGTKTRTRSLTLPTSSDADAVEQCPVQESVSCNTRPCPGRHHCHYLKCRYSFHAATNKYAIQVYHHHKEPHNVHHCKLYETAGGERSCHCFCWNVNAQGKVENGTPGGTPSIGL